MRYLGRAGYETGAVLRVLRMLGRVEGSQVDASLSWLWTHPASVERVRRAESLVGGGGRESRRRYLHMIDGLVFGDDPREGFFRGSVFVQPLMDLRITFPRGWLTRTERSSVVAISPAGEAALVLSPAAGATARAAAEGFRASATLHASPARQEGACWIREFEHQANGDSYRGLACFSERGGRVVRLLGYARSDAFDRNRGAFLAAIGSVGPAGGAARAPRRVQVLDVGPLRVAEFTHAYPSLVPSRTIALINGLDPNDPSAVVPQPAKRIVSSSQE